MGALTTATGEERKGAEIVRGAEECYRHSVKMLEELGFPRGVLPLKDLEECGWVRETGFVWMKLKKAPYEHFFARPNTKVRYDSEVTAVVEMRRMKRLTGVRSRQLLLWVPITEMSINDPREEKIYFKSAVGIGRTFPISAFTDEEEEEEKKKMDA